MVVSLAADYVAVPPHGIEDFIKGGELAFEQRFIPPVLVVDVAPVAVSDICLVADHVFSVGGRTILDAAVDQSGGRIA